jgi:hypothetical protein
MFVDTSVIISSKKFEYFRPTSALVLSNISKWFAANKLVVNVDKTKVMKSVTNNSPHSAFGIGYKENYIEEQ